MAVKYKEYTKDPYKESEELKKAQATANHWGNQSLKDFTYDDFKDSQQTTNFLNQYNSLQGPGDFSFSKQQGMDDIWNQIQNREKFSYDVNGDALYQQYKDQYVNQGKMAMMDTMGQAAAMTGGYGNSYAQSVGQQAMQGHLQQLTDKIPELYSLAMSKYQMEGDELLNKYGLYTDQFNREYGMHRDSVADYNTERGHLADMWSTSHAMDMDSYNANFNKALAEVESYNSNVTSNRNYYTDVYNNLKQTEWGRYMDNETLKKLAIDVANENLYKNEQSRLADAQLAEEQRQFNKQFEASTGYTTDGKKSTQFATAAESNPKIPDYVTKKLEKGFSTNDELDSYLASMESQGIISQAQGDTLYETYKNSSLTGNNWTLKDKGGINWFGGKDNNAVVSYGGKDYTIKQLYNALIGEGKSKSEANDYIAKLQKKLGI